MNLQRAVRVVHVSGSDSEGGAARAAWRLHSAMLAAGVDSWMVVLGKKSLDMRVRAHKVGVPYRIIRRSLRSVTRRLKACQAKRYPAFSSLNLFPTGVPRTVESLEPSIVNLHWVGGDMLSVGEIARIRRPLVWTLHDMWAFCGATHYDEDAPTAVWRAGARSLRDLFNGNGGFVEKMNWFRKAQSWKDLSVRLVAPSRWLADCTSRSELFKGRSTEVIPYTLNMDIFKPQLRELARQRLSLPDMPIILFGADNATRDGRKGWPQLFEALRILSTRKGAEAMCCIFGASGIPEAERLPGLEMKWIGRIDDDATLATWYSAADVMIVPSLMDNLPLTGMEGQACGCPVVTFDVTGTRDLVEHGKTGMLVSGCNPEGLAEAISVLLDQPERARAMRRNARDRALQLWSGTAIVGKYLELYRSILGGPDVEVSAHS